MNATQPATSLKGRRILVGPNEIAGFTSRIAVALASGGAAVRFFNSHDHPFNPPVAETPQLRRLLWHGIRMASRWQARGGLLAFAGMLLAGGVKFLAFAWACFWAQTFVIVGGKGFFGGGIEYAFLRLLGKRVIHVFVGTASRPRYLSGSAREVLQNGTIDPRGLKRLARRTARQARRIRGISRHASVVVENPLCGHFQEKPFVNFFKIGIPLDIAVLEKKPRLSEDTPPRASGKVRVLHCPSNPAVKGSARIQVVIEKLIREGLPIEFRQITGVPHGQVLHEITQADFVVDQLYSDSPMAGFAAEASAFGKAAIVGGYGWALFSDLLLADEIPPTRLCHPDELESAIRSLVLGADERDKAGVLAREFLQSQWSDAAFAERFAHIVTGEIPADWWVKPEHVRHQHGAGIEQSDSRRLVAALVSIYGTGALQLSHNPELRDSLTAAARAQ